MKFEVNLYSVIAFVQSINILSFACLFYLFFQAMIDVSADEGWLMNVLNIITLIQMVNQGRWHTDCPLLQLPCIDEELLPRFRIQNHRQVFHLVHSISLTLSFL